MSLQITSFQLNGRAETAFSDTAEVYIALYTEGGAGTMRFTLEKDGVPCWDSGVLPWSPYCALTLPLNGKCCYTVRAAVESDSENAEASLILYTGVMGQPWRGQWIEPQQKEAVREREILFFEQFVPSPDHFGGHSRLRPAQELQRTFTVETLPRRTMLYASAHGVYTLYLNGHRVDRRRLAPETTPYETMLYYQCYDLSGLVRQGENTLRVLLGDGWWIGRIGLSGDSCQYGDRLGFLGQLELEGEDGTEIIATDERFLSRPSHIVYSDLMMGEKWDLTTPEGDWTPCRLAAEADSTLVLQTTSPICTEESLAPLRVFTAPNGELVADFGRCLAGVVELGLTCERGRTVTLDHSETLDPEGNFFRNILGRNKDQQDTVVCGGGETVFCPEFTYHGFRYVRISGAAREEITFLRALPVGTPLETRGRFSCSHPGLSQLQRNILHSTRSNMVCVPTDCPQREKMGWTGDIQVFTSTGSFNYDLRGFLGAWLGQMRLSQTENGGIPIIIPSYPAQTAMQMKTNGGNTSAAWSDACVLVPLRLYRMYGDKQLLRDNLPMMERWMTYIANASRDHLWCEGYHFGDWLIPSYQNDIEGGTRATAKVIAACQYAITTEAFIEVLESLDEPREKIAQFSSLLQEIRNAVKQAFVSDDGFVEGDLQGLYVMILRCGAVEGSLRQRVAARLAEKIAENGGGLDTGFVSTPYLLDVLTENGYESLAWHLLWRTESPSWLYQVEQGATSIWENWNAIRPDGTVSASSYNHYALGSVGEWIYRHVGGLQPTAAGWRTIDYAPALHCGLDSAECTHLTPYGLAACRWQRDERGTELELTVPHGVTAQLRLDDRTRPLSAGVHRIRL